MAKRSLTLKGEPVAELSSGELGLVAGGVPGPSGGGLTCPLVQCLNSYFVPCTIATR